MRSPVYHYTTKRRDAERRASICWLLTAGRRQRDRRDIRAQRSAVAFCEDAFTDLNILEKGRSLSMVLSLDRVLAYKVDCIRTVKPEEVKFGAR